MSSSFKKILNSYIDLNEILLAEIIDKKEAYIYIQSKIKSPYYSLTIPLAKNISDFDISKIEKKYLKSENKSAIYLLENQQKNGYTEFLVKRGYSFDSRDTWMLFDAKNPTENASSEPKEISSESFDDFYSVLEVVFSDFNGNEPYQRAIKESLGNVKNTLHPDLISKVFVIYEKNKPVSGGGLLYSKRSNFAYLHDTGTLEKFRGRGYQTDLIRHRVKLAQNENISNIFSLGEHGGQSWRNMIKNGFKQEHVAHLLVKDVS